MQDVEPRWLDITSSLVPLGRMMVRSLPEYTLYSTGHKRTVFAVVPQAAPTQNRSIRRASRCLGRAILMMTINVAL
jgi:hypothetical protein